MDKTHVTHIDDGFVFLGHRFIQKRSGRNHMRVVTTIPREKARNFTTSLCASLSGDHSCSSVEKVLSINRRLTGWANFYQFVNYRSMVFAKIDTVVFWKLAHWLAAKHRTRINTVLRRWFRRPSSGLAKTFVATSRIKLTAVIVAVIVDSAKAITHVSTCSLNLYKVAQLANYSVLTLIR